MRGDQAKESRWVAAWEKRSPWWLAEPFACVLALALAVAVAVAGAVLAAAGGQQSCEEADYHGSGAQTKKKSPTASLSLRACAGGTVDEELELACLEVEEGSLAVVLAGLVGTETGRLEGERYRINLAGSDGNS